MRWGAMPIWCRWPRRCPLTSSRRRHSAGRSAIRAPKVSLPSIAATAATAACGSGAVRTARCRCAVRSMRRWVHASSSACATKPSCFAKQTAAANAATSTVPASKTPLPPVRPLAVRPPAMTRRMVLRCPTVPPAPATSAWPTPSTHCSPPAPQPRHRAAPRRRPASPLPQAPHRTQPTPRCRPTGPPTRAICRTRPTPRRRLTGPLVQRRLRSSCERISQPSSASLGGLAEICGVGPIPPDTLGRLACNSDVWGEIFGDNLTPLYETVASRAPTAAQRRALIARDGVCVGCGEPPGECEAHHITPWQRGGKTRVDNLVLVCWRCHDLIHDHNWHVVTRDGSYGLAPPDPAHPADPAPQRKPKPKPRAPRDSPWVLRSSGGP